MHAFLVDNMAPIMFGALVLFLLLGYPVAFSLAACGLVFFIVGVEVAPLSHGTISLSWPLLLPLARLRLSGAGWFEFTGTRRDAPGRESNRPANRSAVPARRQPCA